MKDLKTIFCIFIMGIVGSNYPMKAYVTGVAHSFQSHNLITVTMKEEFRDVKGYEGIYQVSNLGNVKSLRFDKEKILKPIVNSSAYFTVSLWKDSKMKMRTIHQLVAESFLNHKPNGCKLVVNHINFDKLDNKLDNLEVVTQRENANKKHIKSTSKHTGVHWHKIAKKWLARIAINGKRKYLGLFDTELEASNAYQEELKKITA